MTVERIVWSGAAVSVLVALVAGAWLVGTVGAWAVPILVLLSAAGYGCWLATRNRWCYLDERTFHDLLER